MNSRSQQGNSDAGNEETQRRLIGKAVRHSRLAINDVWMYYFSIGGTVGEYEIEAFLHASYSLPPLQRDILAHAVNEMIDELAPPPRAPYCDDVAEERHRRAESTRDSRTQGSAGEQHDG
ncbi:hypothetical protein BJ994_001675 [Arthrobacter pigmenti]|uniref:Uncharacterized protein n=1 Tax=Arthrobacter pigmenti TaxID=271432 RepID=A0A846RND1_9MICC|nr:hypothetical protein [Arthrobacter pigmenti]NJC22599.1 hypothetical protein [Arthrobacter pigmenti]